MCCCGGEGDNYINVCVYDAFPISKLHDRNEYSRRAVYYCAFRNECIINLFLWTLWLVWDKLVCRTQRMRTTHKRFEYCTGARTSSVMYLYTWRDRLLYNFFSSSSLHKAIGKAMIFMFAVPVHSMEAKIPHVIVHSTVVKTIGYCNIIIISVLITIIIVKK